MKIVFYTNCQYKGLQYFLEMFNKYTFDIIENYDIIKNKKPIPIDILNQADIFIYQPIDKKHGIYSTLNEVENNICSYLPESCKKISFPYIYNSAFWILIPPAEIDSFIGNYVNYKYINSEPIEILKQKGKSLDEVIHMYNKNLIDFNYKNRFNNNIKILQEKEKNCDIKVSNFIVTNKRNKLFLTQNHPTSCIYVHCINQLLVLLNIEYEFDTFAYSENICNYPCEWFHTSYDIQYWDFEYNVTNINNDWYIPHIKNIYNNYNCIKNSYENIYPLSFSIPLKSIQNIDITKKTRKFSPLIPGDNKTYIYKDEVSYNENYRESFFAFTYKKGGYDCLRHYEILANNCIPYFIDIENIPNLTMHNFPKDLCSEIINKQQCNNITNDELHEYIKKLHHYTLNNLTCEKSAEYFLSIVKKINYITKNEIKVLLLTSNIQNYSIMMLSYGLRMLLNKDFIDYPKLSSLYNGSVFNIQLNDEYIDRSNIESKIKGHYYDIVIIGSVGPDEPNENMTYYDYVKKNYSKNEIIFILGGDRPYNINTSNQFHNFLNNISKCGICFVRELDDNTNYSHNKSWNEYCNECITKNNKYIEQTKLILNNTI